MDGLNIPGSLTLVSISTKTILFLRSLEYYNDTRSIKQEHKKCCEPSSHNKNGVGKTVLTIAVCGMVMPRISLDSS